MNRTFVQWITAVVFFTTAFSYAQAQGISFVPSSFDGAIDKARQEGRYLFVDCYTAWCGPCKMLARDVFTNDSVGDFFNRHFVSLKVDMEKDEGPALARRYGVNRYPTLLFICPDTREVVYQVVGVRSAQTLLEDARKALDPARNLSGLAARYARDTQDAQAAFDYLNALEANALHGRRDSLLTAYLDNLPEAEICSPANWKILAAHVKTPYSPAFRYLHGHADAFRQCTGVGSEAVDMKLDALYRSATQRFIYRKRLTQAAFPQTDFEYLTTLLEADKGKNAPYYRALLTMIACVQRGEYRDMMTQLDKADRKGVLAPENHFYFVWLNLTYLKESTDTKALKRGLVCLDKLQPATRADDPQLYDACENMRKQLSGN